MFQELVLQDSVGPSLLATKLGQTPNSAICLRTEQHEVHLNIIK